jgi:D-serine deaminase-like pyridoxal phosphate-dependent protein
MSDVQGTLFLARTAGPEMVREEQVPFTDLQQLLDACVAGKDGAAFVRVQVVGVSGGERRRLVLDFGQFGRDER